MASHCVGFTLPGMIEEPGSFSGNGQLAKSAARAGSQPANIVGDLHQRCAQRFHGSLRKNEFVVCGKRRELVGMRAEGQSRQLGDLLGGTLGEFRMRIQSGAHGGSADGEIVEAIEHLFKALDVALQQACPTGEFLADGERHRILQMRAADLDDIGKFLCLGVDGLVHACGSRE